MWMTLALPMAHLTVPTFGAMMLEQMKIVPVVHFTTAPALIVIIPHHRMLEITIIVSQHIKVTALLPLLFFPNDPLWDGQ